MQVRKNTAICAHVPFDFISLYLLVLTFSVKLKDANYKSHWNVLVFCGQWKMISDLNMSHEKFCDFVSVQLFGFFGDITDKFYFLNHWNTLTFFAKKRHDVRFEYVPRKNVWVCLISIVWAHFSHKAEKFRFWKSMKYLIFFSSKKVMPDLNMSCETVSDLIKASLFE